MWRGDKQPFSQSGILVYSLGGPKDGCVEGPKGPLVSVVYWYKA